MLVVVGSGDTTLIIALANRALNQAAQRYGNIQTLLQVEVGWGVKIIPKYFL